MQKEEGGMKMKRNHLLCCLVAAAMLGGCGPESLEKTPQERQTQTADMAQNGKRESGTKREKSGNEGQSEREENSQFADGFGLIEEENPIVFEMEAAPALEGKQEHSEKAVSESSSAWEELGKGISGTAEGDGYKRGKTHTAGRRNRQMEAQVESRECRSYLRCRRKPGRSFRREKRDISRR